MAPINARIDTTEDIKAGMAAYHDQAAGKARIMPANPTLQMETFLGIFNTDRKKIGQDWKGNPVYAEHLAVIADGDPNVLVDGAVGIGDLLQFSATTPGYFTKRTFADLNAVFSDAEIEAEIKRQSILPKIRAVEKATAAGQRIKVILS